MVKLVLSFAIGFVLACSISIGEVGRANDYAARTKEQYKDCAVIGQFPSTADMISDNEGN